MSEKLAATIELIGLCDRLETDAVRILAYIAKRLQHGQRIYGPITIATDPRSFAKEAMEEAADLAVYSTVGLMKVVDSERCPHGAEPRECPVLGCANSETEENKRCERLNESARQSRTNYVVRADAAEATGETCTTETSPSLTRSSKWCGAI